MKWTEERPTEEGWYWIKYRGKEIKHTICPGLVMFVGKGKKRTIILDSARNDTFYEGPHHGGPGFKCHGKLDKSVRFGPMIPFPE